MKIVLSWVFDHLNASISDFDPKQIVELLTLKTVEIESVEEIRRNIDNFACAQIIEEQEEHYVVVDHGGRKFSIKNQGQRFSGDTYLITFDQDQKEWRFSTTKDLGSARDFLLPSFYIKESSINLHQLIPASEIVLTVDNNAIAHRGDLWSHRGFAREISAIFNIPLKPIESLVVTKKLISHVDSVPVTQDSPFSITIENKTACDRFAALFVSHVNFQSSVFDMAARLSLVDCKPIDFLIDATNYVLFDIGQPIHIYDAESLSEKRIVVRNADDNSSLTLLDGETINLTKEDVIVADGLHPITLAGIMGGIYAKVTSKTNALFIESAHFDALSIRQSSAKYHKKTESSLRFSKNTDPNQNVFGITRYLMLLEQYKISHKTAVAIESLGNLVPSNKIIVSHDFIEKKLGISLETSKIRNILNSLGFDVQVQGSTYTILISTHRGTQDLKVPEDIVEEVGRMIGYFSISPLLPSVEIKPKSCTIQLQQKREIKNLLSFGFLMHEVSTYALFDESFLKKISYSEVKTVYLKNPVSSDKTRLVSTLLVALIKLVEEQSHLHDEVRCYEIAKIWREAEDNTIIEQETLSGIFFDKKQPLNFYQKKQYLQRLFSLLKLDVSYQPMRENLPEFSLYDPIHSAVILHKDEIIGHCGMIASSIKSIFDKGDGFMFECDYTKITPEQKIIKYHEISQFPRVKRDFSLLLSQGEIAQDLISFFYFCDSRITSVEIIDVFTKKEWGNKRAVTFRLIIEDKEKTLTSEELDTLFNIITINLVQKGIEIR